MTHKNKQPSLRCFKDYPRASNTSVIEDLQFCLVDLNKTARSGNGLKKCIHRNSCAQQIPKGNSMDDTQHSSTMAKSKTAEEEAHGA